jgi:hypothetical protein
LTPQGCGFKSAFAQQDPIISDSSGTAPSSISLPAASTFPELFNSSVLAAFEASTQANSTTIQPPFASAAAKDQLPSSAPQFAAENGILNAAFMFFTPSSSQNFSGNGKTESTLSTNSTRPKSVLSSVFSIPTKSASPNNHTAEVRDHTGSNSLHSSIASVIPKKPTMVKRHWSPSGAATVTPRCLSTPSSGKYSTRFMPNLKMQIPGNEKTPRRAVSPASSTSKHKFHKSRHGTRTAHISTSKTDNEKTTTYRSTVPRLATITAPASEDSDTRST